jgi:hypothetical protein
MPDQHPSHPQHVSSLPLLKALDSYVRRKPDISDAHSSRARITPVAPHWIDACLCPMDIDARLTCKVPVIVLSPLNLMNTRLEVSSGFLLLMRNMESW